MKNSENIKSVKVSGSGDEQRCNIYKKMTPAEKVAAAGELYFSALALKKAHFRRLHPNWSKQKVEQKVKEWMMYART